MCCSTSAIRRAGGSSPRYSDSTVIENDMSYRPSRLRLEDGCSTCRRPTSRLVRQPPVGSTGRVRAGASRQQGRSSPDSGDGRRSRSPGHRPRRRRSVVASPESKPHPRTDFTVTVQVLDRPSACVRRRTRRSGNGGRVKPRRAPEIVAVPFPFAPNVRPSGGGRRTPTSDGVGYPRVANGEATVGSLNETRRSRTLEQRRLVDDERELLRSYPGRPVLRRDDGVYVPPVTAAGSPNSTPVELISRPTGSSEAGTE